MNESAQPVGGRVVTPGYRIVLGLGILGFVIIAWRFWVGLGPATGLNDGYPWGLWIAFDVVTGTALACGGYAVAILLYILNKGRYHPLIRPAILTSALGYTMAGLAIAVDVGRPWVMWKIPLGGFPDVGSYNWNSALLEVALCVMAYVVVLWIELSPAFFEKWKDTGGEGLRKFSQKYLGVFEKTLIWIVALGILLPTMHQSSLGSLMLLSGNKLHGLWHTPLLPLLFLVSSVAMGYAVVVFESALASRFFGRKPETKMLGSLYGAAVVTIWLFVAIRLVDLFVQGKAALLFGEGLASVMFWLEMGLVIVAALMFHLNRGPMRLGTMFRGAILMALSGGLYRFDTYLVGFNPGDHWGYFPTVPELFVTLGIIALEIAAYVYLVKKFPILAGRPAAGSAH